tara:strand:+ start:297 stop:1166 length:870 start_codon:yes stop_codon:yes gene_type:complete
MAASPPLQREKWRDIVTKSTQKLRRRFAFPKLPTIGIALPSAKVTRRVAAFVAGIVGICIVTFLIVGLIRGHWPWSTGKRCPPPNHSAPSGAATMTCIPFTVGKGAQAGASTKSLLLFSTDARAVWKHGFAIGLRENLPSVSKHATHASSSYNFPCVVSASRVQKGKHKYKMVGLIELSSVTSGGVSLDMDNADVCVRFDEGFLTSGYPESHSQTARAIVDLFVNIIDMQNRKRKLSKSELDNMMRPLTKLISPHMKFSSLADKMNETFSMYAPFVKEPEMTCLDILLT